MEEANLGEVSTSLIKSRWINRFNKGTTRSGMGKLGLINSGLVNSSLFNNGMGSNGTVPLLGTKLSENGS